MDLQAWIPSSVDLEVSTAARAALLSEVEIRKEQERGQLEWDKIKTA